MKKTIYTLIAILSLTAGYSQRNISDLFFAQGVAYYNPAYSPTHELKDERASSFDTHTMLNIAPNNTGSKVTPSLTYQGFTRIKNFTVLYGVNYQAYSFVKNNEIDLGLAYSIPFKSGENHRLSFGVRGDFSFYGLKDFNAIDYVNVPKPRKLTVLPDVDFGIYYTYRQLALGVSGIHLAKSKYEPDDILLQNERNFHFIASYNFYIGNNFELKPTLFLPPMNYTDVTLAVELGIFHQVYVQYAFRLGQLRSQYNIEYRPMIRGQQFFFGLAFNHSLIYTDFNAGLRIGYNFSAPVRR